MERFVLGLAMGLCLLWLYQRRNEAKLKRLLRRLEAQTPLPTLGYDAQLASAITGQKAQLEDVIQQLQELKQVLRHAPVGYLQVDEENRLLWCNQRAQEFLDIEQSDYDEPRLLLAIVRSYELDQLVESTRQQQSICEASWTFNSISTDPLNYLERPAYPLKGYGLPMKNGHVGVFLENRQEAVTLARQRDRWISDVAHELKTPLTSIRLVAETLQARVAPELLSWTERLLKEVIRLSKLVDDVLNMSSLEQHNGGTVAGEEADLGALVKAAWQSIEPLARLKRVDLDYQGPEQLMARVKVSWMHRVLVNLLSNAVKYSPPGESIRVRLSLRAEEAARSEARVTPAGEGTCILIEVIDAGEGLAPRDLPYVFDRFYRADPARSRQQAAETIPPESDHSLEIAELSSSGTGLGLAIVRQIVASHEGRVEAKNSPETGGAWIQVWLPGKRLVKKLSV